MFTILHTESSTGWGGQENRTLQESIGLKKLGARVIILCQSDSSLSKIAAAEGIEVRTCKMKKSYDIFAIQYILKLIRDQNIDVINTHSGRDSFLAGIAGRLSKRKPIIVRTRHLALPITSKFTYNVLPHKVVTVSEYVRQYLINAGIPKDKVVAIPTGINITRFDSKKAHGSLRQELGLKTNTPIVGTIAILRKKKGHHILLDAIPLILQKIPDVVFVFAGDGPQKENIMNKITNMGLSDKVFMLGLRNDIPEILKSIDLFVLPTLQEALGTSFIEAMAMGKPVVGTDVGGVGEVIKDGINGYLVEPNNPLVLADAVIKILEDREKAIAMGIEGREIVEQNYTVEKMCEKMYALYSSLLAAKTGIV
ncbi:glycosyl transferase group 1 [Dissulfurispira thermophila]|uniref:Glycosyl transferase group 1 n=2 Tax=root TaxID=1 RepID=A0A7G1H5C5_9BACT|nr:glycosyltransferase family 4 protein [Dissulfurispira thermophila]BCB97292.1 glycosyl transferase group 1 [Dissulfurispira thermophila]